MDISRNSAVILTAFLVLALACDYAAAQKGDELGTGGDEPTVRPDKEAGGQAPATQPAGQQPPGKGKGGGFWRDQGMFIVMIGGMFLLFMWMGRSKRKQAAKRKEMLSNLNKGDKVTTIGGIVGTVIEVREDEITVKVDETNNNRLRFARWAIRGVGDQAKVEGPDQRK